MIDSNRINILGFPQTPWNKTEHLRHGENLLIEHNGISAREERLLLLVQNDI